MFQSLTQGFVEITPAVQELIVFGLTFIVSFLILQITAKVPALGAYLGQYKNAIIVWLTGLVLQLVQAGLNQIPVEWESVAAIALQLIVAVVGVLLVMAGWKKAELRGTKALL